MKDIDIKTKWVNGHYEIYVDCVFRESCDLNELQETLKEIEDEYADN